MTYKTFEDYKKFADEVKHENRSFLSPKNLEFLEWLEQIAQKHVITLSVEKELFRARKSKTKKHLIAESEMKPTQNLGSSGRANAFNIPVLYLADNPEIAIAEIRPELREHVTVATFQPSHELKIIDFAGEKADWAWYFQQQKVLGNEKEHHINDCLVRIGGEFSKSLSVNDKTIEYIPTQVIADYFKHKGYDGIAYQTQFQTAENQALFRNFALFNLSAAKVTSRQLFEVNQLFVKSQLIEHYKEDLS